jgi:hypothetical protein
MSARTVVALALVPAMALAGGCGRYARRGASGPTATTGGNVGVGAGLTEGTTTTIGAGSSSPKPSGSGTASPPSATVPAGTNRSTSEDSGLRFVFTVDNKTTFGAHEDFALEVTITNISGHVLTYEPNQPRNFILSHPVGTTGAQWFDSDCNPPKPAGATPALQMQPNQEIHLSAMYPGPPGAANRERCRRSPDQYVAGALFALCDRVRDSDGSCDPNALHYAKSLGVRITIG